MCMVNLYQWQTECIDRWVENGCRGIAHVVTGAGKTVMALAAAGRIRNRYPGQVQVRIVVPKIDLAKQWKNEIFSYFSKDGIERKDIGLYYGKVKNHPDLPFVIYVINTAREVLSGHIQKDMEQNKHVLLICDECHRAAGPENRRIFSFRSSRLFQADLYHCIGLSGTPYCDNFEEVLVPALGGVFYVYDVAAAKSGKQINDFAVIHTEVSLNGTEAAEYGELCVQISALYAKLLKDNSALQYMGYAEFIKTVRECAAEEPGSIYDQYLNKIQKRRKLIYEAANRIPCVISLINRIGVKEKIILFTERREQTDEVYRKLLPVYGNRIVHYHSGMDHRLRREQLDLFRIGEARILVACKALDEGLDVPDASAGIVISCTGTQRQRVQRLGRIIRKKDGKPVSRLFYIHTANTVESSYYLTDLPEDTVTMRITYDGESDRFYNTAYEDAAVHVYRQLESHMSQKMKNEFVKCLEEGLTECDWLMNSDYLQRQMQKCSDQHEKNYWFIMQKLSETEQEN